MAAPYPPRPADNLKPSKAELQRCLTVLQFFAVGETRTAFILYAVKGGDGFP